MPLLELDRIQHGRYILQEVFYYRVRTPFYLQTLWYRVRLNPYGASDNQYPHRDVDILQQSLTRSFSLGNLADRPRFLWRPHGCRELRPSAFPNLTSDRSTDQYVRLVLPHFRSDLLDGRAVVHVRDVVAVSELVDHAPDELLRALWRRVDGDQREWAFA